MKPGHLPKFNRLRQLGTYYSQYPLPKRKRILSISLEVEQDTEQQLYCLTGLHLISLLI